MKIKFALSTLSTILALTFMSSASAADGINLFDGDQSIVGGTEAPVGRYTHTVALSYLGSQYCGGSLIAPDVVLTAAHCMDGASFDVIINRHDLTTSAGESIPRRNEIKHPNYNGNTMTNDFALVFLNRGTTEKVDFVKLNQDNSYPSAGSSSRAMGWGTTSSGGSSSSVLREVDLPVISNQQCSQQYPQETIFANNICTFKPGKDTCQGDSGGPLIMPGTDAAGDILIGLTSWGYGCASQQYPGVYARVSNQIEWIKTTMCKESSFPPAYLCGSNGTPSPTKKPSPSPTNKPTPKPTPSPTKKPSVSGTTSPTNKPTPKPTLRPVTGKPTLTSDVCYPKAQKVKIQSTNGKPIHVFEVNLMSNGIPVARKSASQSSTLKPWASADRAIDGNVNTFSHTADANAWLEIDLEELSPISSVEIANRWCRDLSDPSKCLCRLANAELTLIDDTGVVIATKSLGDTCGVVDVSIGFDPISCSPPTPPSGGCNNAANKVLVESTTGETLHVFELEAYSRGVNVAEGSTAAQSSTLKNFKAIRAVDGNFQSFSHTALNDSNAWLSVDFGGTEFIETVIISNRYCGRKPSDPLGCLCRLSNARVSLVDADGNTVQSKTLGDTCGILDVFVDFDDGCSSGETDIPTFFPTTPCW